MSESIILKKNQLLLCYLVFRIKQLSIMYSELCVKYICTLTIFITIHIKKLNINMGRPIKNK